MPRPTLSLLDTTLLVMGSIIGVGVFFTPGSVARLVPDGPGLLLLWALGAGIALCGAATFAELGLNRPVTGGWFSYLEQAFGPRIAFLFAWTILAVVSTASIAVIADFCAQRLAGLVGGLSPGQTVSLSTGLILFATGLCLLGVKTGALFQNLCMALKLLAIAALVFAGFVLASGAGLAGAAPPDAAAPNPANPANPAGPGLLKRFAPAAALLPILFTYGGWQNICYIAEDVRNPRRNLPRGILLGVLGVALVYLSINAAYLRAFGAEGLAQEPRFAVRLSNAAFGPLGETFVEAAMAISALGILVVTVLVTPNIYVALAQKRLLPPAFGRQNPRTGAPTLGLWAQCALALAYLLWARALPLSPGLAPHAIDLDALVGSIAFAEWLFHGLAALALLRWRRTPSHQRLPHLTLAPHLYLATALTVVLTNLWTNRGPQTLLGLAALALGLIAYRLLPVRTSVAAPPS
jgi:APA family basic amino acid/polyamine antiporter